MTESVLPATVAAAPGAAGARIVPAQDTAAIGAGAQAARRPVRASEEWS